MSQEYSAVTAACLCITKSKWSKIGGLDEKNLAVNYNDVDLCLKSKKYNLSIIPVFIKRTEENNFVIEFQNEVNPSDYKDKLALSQKLNSILEKMISKNPGQWIWTHDRWKK